MTQTDRDNVDRELGRASKINKAVVAEENTGRIIIALWIAELGLPNKKSVEKNCGV